MRSDEFWMHEALREAQECLRSGSNSNHSVSEAVSDVPVGAICVLEGRIIGRGHNRREIDRDPSAHAEMLAMRAAAQELGDWRLEGVTLYVTLEPCPMCAGAIVNSRVERVIFGAYDPKAGSCGTLYTITEDERLNHRAPTLGGVLDGECGAILKEYFLKKRKTSDKMK